MTDQAKIMEASGKHPKPEGREFQYGTAGVCVTHWKARIVLMLCEVPHEGVCYDPTCQNGRRMSTART